MRTLAGAWKVAALCAPAGYGKSTLASQVARGHTVLWCRLTPEDRDPAHLLGSLLVAAARARRPFGTRTRRLFESRRDMERDGAFLTASFLHELARGRGRTLVVLDDAHALAEARPALQWLRGLIEDSGPSTRFLITCRGECPLPLARFDLMGGSRVLRARDLQFTAEEQSRLLRRIGGPRALALAPAALMDAIRGWPAGVVLAARHLGAGASAPVPRRALVAPGGEGGDERRLAGALDYLAEEVFAPLPPRLRETLCRAALLDELDRAALVALAGGAAADLLLRETARRDLFLERLPDATEPRFHPLFRGFLRSRLDARTDPAERRRLGERLARHWMQRGEAAAAIRALADTGSLEAAVRLFDEAAAGPRGGRGDALGPVALELSRGARAPSALSPGLLLHGAFQARDSRRFDETVRLARGAQDGFVRRRAYLAAARAFGLEAEIALSGGKLRDARGRGEALLRRFPARQRAARGTLARHLGTLLLHMGDPARARARLGDAARWLKGAGHEIDQAEVALAQATVAYTEGHWDVYLGYARRALPAFRRAGYLERAGNTLINMGEACTYLGLEDVALGHFDEARALLRRRGDAEDPLVLIYRARARSERGELAEAAREFAAAREPVRRHGHPMQAVELDVWDGICARRRGRLEEAEVRLARAQAVFAGMDSPAWLALARMERALVRGLEGQTAEALRELAAAGRVTRRLGDMKELARNGLFEARVRQAAGSPVRTCLARALGALERLDYLVLLRKEADVAGPLLAFALGDRVLRPRALRCLPALPDALRRRIEREAADVGRVPRAGGDGISMPAVRVRMLGGFEVHVGERAVRFPRRASATLVACLALRGGAPVRREALAEALWPDAPVAASRNRFDVALNAARHALEPDVPARGPFRLLTSDGGLCRLAPSGLVTDVACFERHARDSEPASARASGARRPVEVQGAAALARLEAALQAYGGELLPGIVDVSWVEAERERLRDRHHRLLLRYGGIALLAGRAADAADVARRILDQDALHEEALRLLMRGLAARGERAAAVRACQQLERRLSAELDTAASPETVALRRELSEPEG